MDTKYNGWTNYETWDVKLWIDNDESLSNYWTERAEFMVEDCEHDDAIRLLAVELEEWHDENAPTVTVSQASVYSDLMGHALGMVDWYEIAENMITDIESVNEPS
jgi:hypothetical protein